MADQTALATKPAKPYDRFKLLIKSDNIQERFQQLLDKRSTEFLASLLSLVGADDKLMECEPISIFTAAAKAAVLRLPVSKELGYAWIIPYKDHGTPKAQFQIGYKGLIQLAFRTGQYLTINATPIYEGQQVVEDQLTGSVKLNGSRTGDGVIGYAAYFKLKNGMEKFLYMDRERVEAHAKRYSKSYGNQKSAWTTNFDDMGQVTVLRLLLRRWGLLSIEMVDTEAPEPPLMGDDPRLAVPDFADNVLDGEAHDVPENSPPPVEPERSDPPEPEPAPDLTAQIVAAAIEAGHTENEHSGRNAIKLSRLTFESVEQGVEWFRCYRGWRNLDDKPASAAASADKGEAPK